MQEVSFPIYMNVDTNWGLARCGNSYSQLCGTNVIAVTGATHLMSPELRLNVCRMSLFLISVELLQEHLHVFLTVCTLWIIVL